MEKNTETEKFSTVSAESSAKSNEPIVILAPAGPVDPPKEKGRKKSAAKPVTTRNVTAYITKIAILSALSTVLYLFARFPIFPAFPFNVLDMDFSDIPALIGGFSMGPVAGVIIVLIKCVIKLSTSSTMLVGELSNFIVGCALVLPASLYYKFHKTRKGALIALVIGVLVNAAVSIFNNYFITVPLYAEVFLPSIMEVRVEFACEYGLAFNLIKSTVASVVTFVLYKKLSPILHL